MDNKENPGSDAATVNACTAPRLDVLLQQMSAAEKLAQGLVDRLRVKVSAIQRTRNKETKVACADFGSFYDVYHDEKASLEMEVRAEGEKDEVNMQKVSEEESQRNVTKREHPVKAEDEYKNKGDKLESSEEISAGKERRTKQGMNILGAGENEVKRGEMKSESQYNNTEGKNKTINKLTQKTELTKNQTKEKINEIEEIVKNTEEKDCKEHGNRAHMKIKQNETHYKKTENITNQEKNCTKNEGSKIEDELRMKMKGDKTTSRQEWKSNEQKRTNSWENRVKCLRKENECGDKNKESAHKNIDVCKSKSVNLHQKIDKGRKKMEILENKVDGDMIKKKILERNSSNVKRKVNSEDKKSNTGIKKLRGNTSAKKMQSSAHKGGVFVVKKSQVPLKKAENKLKTSSCATIKNEIIMKKMNVIIKKENNILNNTVNAFTKDKLGEKKINSEKKSDERKSNVGVKKEDIKVKMTVGEANKELKIENNTVIGLKREINGENKNKDGESKDKSIDVWTCNVALKKTGSGAKKCDGVVMTIEKEMSKGDDTQRKITDRIRKENREENTSEGENIKMMIETEGKEAGKNKFELQEGEGDVKMSYLEACELRSDQKKSEIEEATDETKTGRERAERNAKSEPEPEAAEYAQALSSMAEAATLRLPIALKGDIPDKAVQSLLRAAERGAQLTGSALKALRDAERQLLQEEASAGPWACVVARGAAARARAERVEEACRCVETALRDVTCCFRTYGVLESSVCESGERATAIGGRSSTASLAPLRLHHRRRRRLRLSSHLHRKSMRRSQLVRWMQGALTKHRAAAHKVARRSPARDDDASSETLTSSVNSSITSCDTAIAVTGSVTTPTASVTALRSIVADVTAGTDVSNETPMAANGVPEKSIDDKNDICSESGAGKTPSETDSNLGMPLCPPRTCITCDSPSDSNIAHKSPDTTSQTCGIYKHETNETPISKSPKIIDTSGERLKGGGGCDRVEMKRRKDYDEANVTWVPWSPDDELEQIERVVLAVTRLLRREIVKRFPKVRKVSLVEAPHTDSSQDHKYKPSQKLINKMLKVLNDPWKKDKKYEMVKSAKEGKEVIILRRRNTKDVTKVKKEMAKLLANAASICQMQVDIPTYSENKDSKDELMHEPDSHKVHTEEAILSNIYFDNNSMTDFKSKRKTFKIMGCSNEIKCINTYENEDPDANICIKENNFSEMASVRASSSHKGITSCNATIKCENKVENPEIRVETDEEGETSEGEESDEINDMRHFLFNVADVETFNFRYGKPMEKYAQEMVTIWEHVDNQESRHAFSAEEYSREDSTIVLEPDGDFSKGTDMTRNNTKDYISDDGSSLCEFVADDADAALYRQTHKTSSVFQEKYIDWWQSPFNIGDWETPDQNLINKPRETKHQTMIFMYEDDDNINTKESYLVPNSTFVEKSCAQTDLEIDKILNKSNEESKVIAETVLQVKSQEDKHSVYKEVFDSVTGVNDLLHRTDNLEICENASNQQTQEVKTEKVSTECNEFLSEGFTQNVQSQIICPKEILPLITKSWEEFSVAHLETELTCKETMNTSDSNANLEKGNSSILKAAFSEDIADDITTEVSTVYDEVYDVETKIHEVVKVEPKVKHNSIPVERCKPQAKKTNCTVNSKLSLINYSKKTHEYISIKRDRISQIKTHNKWGYHEQVRENKIRNIANMQSMGKGRMQNVTICESEMQVSDKKKNTAKVSKCKPKKNS